MDQKTAFILGGSGLLAAVACFALWLFFTTALDERGQKDVAEYQGKQDTARADHLEAVITKFSTIDKEAEDARTEIKTIDQSGAANPAVGPRVNAAMRRMYARQVQRDAARGADSGANHSPAPVAR